MKKTKKPTPKPPTALQEAYLLNSEYTAMPLSKKKTKKKK